MFAQSPALTLITRGFHTMTAPFRRARTAADLSQLDDRLLKDVGLTRFDVDLMRRMW